MTIITTSRFESYTTLKDRAVKTRNTRHGTFPLRFQSFYFTNSFHTVSVAENL